MLDDNVPKPWQGQTTLVFALAAAAVGLGNVFRLPYLLGEHGGAPFFIAYVATVLLVIVPVLAAEVMLGSHGRGSPLAAIRWASDQSGRSIYWSWLGPLQALMALLVASQLVVFCAWFIDRAMVINSGSLAAASAQDVASSFLELVRDQRRNPELWLGILVLAAALGMRGPKLAMGIIGWLLLPAMMVAGFGLLDYTLNRGDLIQAQEFLFATRYDAFGFDAAMAGVVSAIYTLGAGLGIGLCFGARAPKRLPLLRAVVAAAVLDVAFALATAIVVVPLLFATNSQPVEGAALIMVAVPYAYANLPLGEVYGAVFYGFLAAATFSALVALMEPAVILLRRDADQRRWLAAPLVATLVGLMAWVQQFVLVDTWYWLGRFVDLAVPLSLLLMAVFVGWAMPRPIVRGELFREPQWLFSVWWESLRLGVPVVLIMVCWWLLRSPIAPG